MKLYIKQKIFSFKDKFSVFDEYGNAKYFVEGELFSWGKKLHLYDMYGNELAMIHQKAISLMPKFFVYINGQLIAEIVKKATFLSQKYEIRGLNWITNGNFSAHDYQITAGGYIVASIHKQWMSWGDSYELCINEQQNEAVTLAVVLAIDCAMFSK